MAFDVGAIVGRLQLKKDKWDQSLKAVKADQRSLSGLVARNSKQFKKMGKSMTIAGGLIVGAVALMVKAYANFDEAMTESLAIMGDISDEMRKDMADVARTISEETVYSAKELAEAYYFLASAGMDASQSMTVLGDVARFAQAGKFDLTTATDLLTDAQTAMGLSSKDVILNQKEMIRVSDVLVGANTLANASVLQFSEALTTKAAAALVNVNKELEEGVAVLAAFADKGIKGRLAGTQLGMMLNALDLAAMRNKKAWQAHGLTLWTSTGQMKSMGDIIADLEDLLGDMTPELRSATLAQLGFTVKTKASVLTLMGSSEKIKKWTEDLKNMGGITKEVSDKQLKTLNAQLKLLRNTVVNAAISIGESLAPMIGDLIIKVKEVAKKVSDWIKEHPKLTAFIGKTALKVGVLLMVLGPLAIMLPGLVQSLTYLGVAAKTAAVGMGALTLAVGAAYGAYKGLLWIRDRVEGKATSAQAARDKELKGWQDLSVAVGGLGDFLTAAEKKMGLSREKTNEILKKYKGDFVGAFKAISEGTEGKKLKKFLESMAGKEVEAAMGAEDFALSAKNLLEELEKLSKEGLDLGSAFEEKLIPALKTVIPLLKFTISPAMELARQFAEGKISIIEYTAGLQDLRAVAERIKDPFKDLAQAESEIQIETDAMTDSWNVLKAAGVPATIYDQLTAVEKLKQEVVDTTDTITIRFKSMTEHILDFTRDLAAGWADVFVDMLGITESITYQMKEFDNSYWESTMQNALEAYEDKKSLLEKQLEDAAGYYSDLEDRLTWDYEKRKEWIEANVKDEEKKQEMLLKLEQKHQADLENLRADQRQKEADLQDSLVELEENHQTESERIRSEEDAAREQHAIDEYDRQNTLWNKVKGVFGDAVDNMLYTWTTDFVQGMLLGATDVAKGLVSELGSAFKTVKSDAISTGSKVSSELGGIGGLISGIAKGIATLITTLATAVAKAATTLAAAAPALLVVLGIALAAYAGFKLISSLFKKKPETGTMEAILGDIAYVFLNAICLKLDGLNDHITNFFPKIDYMNSILAKTENINKEIRGYTKKTADGVATLVKKLGSLTELQTGGYIPRTQLAVLHAGETVIPSPTVSPPGLSTSSVTGRGASPETGRQNIHISIKPLVIPRGDKYIVDFVIEDIKHGRKIPIEAIGG